MVYACRFWATVLHEVVFCSKHTYLAQIWLAKGDRLALLGLQCLRPTTPSWQAPCSNKPCSLPVLQPTWATTPLLPAPLPLLGRNQQAGCMFWRLESHVINMTPKGSCPQYNDYSPGAVVFCHAISRPPFMIAMAGKEKYWRIAHEVLITSDQK